MPEFDVSDPLLKHVVDRFNGGLNVVGLCSEEISYCWDSITLLCLPNIVQIVHYCSNEKLVLFILGAVLAIIRTLSGPSPI